MREKEEAERASTRNDDCGADADSEEGCDSVANGDVAVVVVAAAAAVVVVVAVAVAVAELLG